MPADKYRSAPVGISAKNRQVQIQKLVKTPDGQGGNAVTWTTQWTCWASLDQSKGLEVFAQAQVAGQTFYTATIWYRQGVTPDMRIVYGDRVFDIRSVDDVAERHVELKLLLQEHNGL